MVQFTQEKELTLEIIRRPFYEQKIRLSSFFAPKIIFGVQFLVLIWFGWIQAQLKHHWHKLWKTQWNRPIIRMNVLSSEIFLIEVIEEDRTYKKTMKTILVSMCMSCWTFVKNWTNVCSFRMKEFVDLGLKQLTKEIKRGPLKWSSEVKKNFRTFPRKTSKLENDLSGGHSCIAPDKIKYDRTIKYTAKEVRNQLPAWYFCNVPGIEFDI